MRVLISGGGIAGLTLAYWLRRHALEPTVVEAAPGVRGGGYMIDFWGVGYEIASRMGVLDAIAARHQEIDAVAFVDKRNRVKGRLEVQQIRRMLNGRHYNLLRSGLERALYESIKDSVDVRFATSIVGLREHQGGVEVQLDHGRSESWDLVVGADGLRSNVRRLVFGADSQFERYMGYCTASFTIPDTTAHHGSFASYSVPHKQVSVYPMGDGTLATFFIYATAEPPPWLPQDARKRILEREFRDVGWETDRILSRINDAPDFYFDAVSQIEMPAWSRSRVTLAGDACQCVSLLSGQGSGLAMAGAYILAGELKRADDDFRSAFEQYESKVKPEIKRKQALARRFARSFVPSSRPGVWLRNQAVRLMALPVLSRYFVDHFLSDELRLEPY